MYFSSYRKRDRPKKKSEVIIISFDASFTKNDYYLYLLVKLFKGGRMSVITIMEEEVYDSLSQTQKHIMLKNGAFEFDSFKQCSCYCGHSVSDHLDYIDCCLSKELCLCDKFLDKESKVTIPKKLRRKEDVLQKETGQLDNYIQTLARI